MYSTSDLCIYEELLLLALDEEKGTTTMGGLHETGMGGAVLAELIFHGAIRIGQDYKRLVTAAAGVVMDDPLLQEVLAMIQEKERPASASDWVLTVGGMKDLKNRVARRLVSKGILREDSDKVMRIFHRTIYPETNAGPEKELIARMREAILTDSKDVTERTILIIVLARATSLLRPVCTKQELKTHKKRISELAAGNVTGKATKEAMAAVQGAMMVIMIATATVV